MKEYCKYTGKWMSHDDQITECKINHDKCVKLYPCAFFIVYNREIF